MGLEPLFVAGLPKFWPEGPADLSVSSFGYFSLIQDFDFGKEMPFLSSSPVS